jgi:hypothetical protein
VQRVLLHPGQQQALKGIARFARDLNSYLRVAPPLHPGLPFFARAKKGNRKKARSRSLARPFGPARRLRLSLGLTKGDLKKPSLTISVGNTIIAELFFLGPVAAADFPEKRRKQSAAPGCHFFW